MSNITKIEQSMQLTGNVSPENILTAAIEKGVSPEVMQQLLDMRRQLQAEMAKEAYYRDFPKFKKAIKPPKRTKSVYDKYGKLRYKYAPLEEVQKSIDDALNQTGNLFSYRWQCTSQTPSTVTMCCYMTHFMGHSEPSPFENPIDKDSYMSPGQKVGSARTFAKRYTLLDVCGLEAEDDIDQIPEEHTVEKPKPIIPKLFTRTEIEIAYKAVESAQDPAEACRRVLSQAKEAGDTAAYDELKQRFAELAKRREQQVTENEARTEKDKGKKKKESSPGFAEPVISEEQIEDLEKKIESVGINWDDVVRETGARFGHSIELVFERDYDDLIVWLNMYNPMHKGVVKISLKQCHALYVKLNKAGIPKEQFKEYHGIESAKDIDLADFENMMDFEKSGLLEWIKSHENGK